MSEAKAAKVDSGDMGATLQRLEDRRRGWVPFDPVRRLFDKRADALTQVPSGTDLFEFADMVDRLVEDHPKRIHVINGHRRLFRTLTYPWELYSLKADPQDPPTEEDSQFRVNYRSMSRHVQLRKPPEGSPQRRGIYTTAEHAVLDLNGQAHIERTLSQGFRHGINVIMRERLAADGSEFRAVNNELHTEGDHEFAPFIRPYIHRFLRAITRQPSS